MPFEEDINQILLTILSSARLSGCIMANVFVCRICVIVGLYRKPPACVPDLCHIFVTSSIAIFILRARCIRVT